jgi:phosphohistidine phosphatase
LYNKGGDMSRLYFLRHGIAVLSGTPGFMGDDRPLTEEGIEKMSKAAKGIRRLVENFDIILTSPLKRAQETALLVAKEMNIENKVEVAKALAPGCKIKELLQLLSKYADKEDILLVGREPDFSQMISALAGVAVAGAGASAVELKKGGLCRLDIDGPEPGQGAKIVQLLPPKILRMLAKK